MREERKKEEGFHIPPTLIQADPNRTDLLIRGAETYQARAHPGIVGHPRHSVPGTGPDGGVAVAGGRGELGHGKPAHRPGI